MRRTLALAALAGLQQAAAQTAVTSATINIANAASSGACARPPRARSRRRRRPAPAASRRTSARVTGAPARPDGPTAPPLHLLYHSTTVPPPPADGCINFVEFMVFNPDGQLSE